MADISRLLNEASGKAEQVRQRLEEESKSSPQSPAEDASRLQAKLNWRTSTITEEMFKAIGNQVRELENTASELACNAFDEKARIAITHLLIKAKTLREVITTYTK